MNAPTAPAPAPANAHLPPGWRSDWSTQYNCPYVYVAKEQFIHLISIADLP